MRTTGWLFSLCFICLADTAVAQQQTVWQTDLEAAKRVAQQTGRPVLVHLWAPWCAPCVELEKAVFSQPGFEQAISARFVPVKLNVDNHPNIAGQYAVTQIPTDLVLAPDGRLIARLASPPTAAEYLSNLNRIAGGPVAAVPGGPTNPAQPPNTPPAQRGALAGPAAPQAPPWNSPPAAGCAPGGPGHAMAAMNNPTPTQPAYQPPAPGAGPAQAASQVGSLVESTYQAGTPSATQQPAPVGLDGYCPVALCEQHQWVPGNRQWGCVYRGRTYLFCSEEAKQKFWNNPDRYAPVASGIDPVLAVEQGQQVDGRRAHGVFFEDRVYLFADEQSLERFRQNPDRYAAEILQARR
jgi:YHS domain-containing protein/thiol-disulfide isomerase/thioredoxin